jgi:hypothetical protein
MRINFTCHCQTKFFKNIIKCNNLSRKCRFQQNMEIVGIISGEIPPIQHPNSIICPSKMFILQGLSSGSGTPVVLIKLRSLLGCRNILKRKKHKLQGNKYNCVLCSAHCEETIFHLFFFMSF